MTTVVSGLHPLVTSALEAHGCGTLTSVQHQTLSRVTVGGTSVPPDCIVETPRGSGHCLCMVAYAAHFVHSQTGGSQPFAVIVARDQQSLQRILSVCNVASIPAVRFVDATMLDRKSRIGSSVCPLSSRVLVGTLEALSALDFGNAADARANCVTLLVEEAAGASDDNGSGGGNGHSAAANNSSTTTSSRNNKGGNNNRNNNNSNNIHQQSQSNNNNNNNHDNNMLAEFICSINSLWPNVNLCLMSSRPPSAIHASLRYLLRRNNRCYLPARSAVPVFSTILCLNAEDRVALCHRVTQITGLRRVLILTHNRDVKDLKTELHKSLGLRTFAIQRATPQEERERVLTDFLECDYGVLVAMDAFTGVDLIDVDGVIQFYPPQKSMTDEEWSDYVLFLRTTGESGLNKSRAVVVTLAATDDLSMIKHLQSRVGFTGPVLNISPNHVNFEDFVLQSNLAVLAKLPAEEQEAAAGGPASISMTKKKYVVARTGAAVGIPTPSSQQQGGKARRQQPQQQLQQTFQQQQQQQRSNNNSSRHHDDDEDGYQPQPQQQQQQQRRQNRQLQDNHTTTTTTTTTNNNNNMNTARLAIPTPSSGGQLQLQKHHNNSNKVNSVHHHADPEADVVVAPAIPRQQALLQRKQQQQSAGAEGATTTTTTTTTTTNNNNNNNESSKKRHPTRSFQPSDVAPVVAEAAPIAAVDEKPQPKKQQNKNNNNNNSNNASSNNYQKKNQNNNNDDSSMSAPAPTAHQIGDGSNKPQPKKQHQNNKNKNNNNNECVSSGAAATQAAAGSGSATAGGGASSKGDAGGDGTATGDGGGGGDSNNKPAAKRPYFNKNYQNYKKKQQE